MKNFLKKATAIVLTAAMTLSIGIPAFANEGENDVVLYAGEEYIQSEISKDLYVSENEEYIMYYQKNSSALERTSMGEKEEVIIPMERMDVSFDDINSVNMLLNRTDIPEEAIESFEAKYELYNSQDDCTAVPCLSVYAPRANGEPDDIEEDNLYGCEMLSYIFEYRGETSPWFELAKGYETKSKLDIASELLLMVGENVSSVVNLLANGDSLLEEFGRYFSINTVSITPNTNDYYKARVDYHQTEKYTMRNFAGEWQTGLVTFYVEVCGYDTDIYLADSGEFAKLTENDDIYVSIESPDYDDPWETAYDNGRYTEYQTVTWTTVDDMECEFAPYSLEW